MVSPLPGRNSCVNEEILLLTSFLRCHLFQLDDPDFIKLPIPNDRVLPTVESLQIHEVLSEAQESLATLELEIARTKVIHDDLLAKREKYISRMERLQAMVAPQKSLPDEILAEIFVFAASETTVTLPPILTDCPWILTRVCSRWRLVALSERRLWTRVLLSDSRKVEDTRSLIPAAEEVFRRSGRSLMELTVRQRGSGKLLISIIAPHLNRVQDLRLDVHAFFMAKILSLPPPALCALEENTLIPSDDALPSNSYRISEGAHGLRKLALTPGFLGGEIIFPTHFRFPWNQLTSLELGRVSFNPSAFYEVLSQCSGLVTLKITGTDFYAEDLDEPDTIFLPRLETLEISLRPRGRTVPRDLCSLVVPALSCLSFVAHGWGPDYNNLFNIADMLDRSSPPLIDLYIMVTNGVEVDIGPILQHCPRLVFLDAPLSYLDLPTLQKITRGEWAPNIQELYCRIHHHLSDAFLDMLETKWEHEIGIPVADCRLMSRVEFFVNGPDDREDLVDPLDDPLASRLIRIQERLGCRNLEVRWINESPP